MSNRRSDALGKLFASAAAIVFLAVTAAAAILPFFLIAAYFNYALKARRLRRQFPKDGQVAWLNEEERIRFKKIYPEYLEIESAVEFFTSKSEDSSLPRKMDGSLDFRNPQNKEIQTNLDRANSLLETHGESIENLRFKNAEKWDELNKCLIAKAQCGMALCGWFIGAAYYYARIQAGVPFTIWVEFFIPAVLAGLGAIIPKIFVRSPACVYAAEPGIVDIRNVDSPEIIRPLRKKNRLVQILVLSLWIYLSYLSFQKGKKQGQAEVIAHRNAMKFAKEKAEARKRMTENAVVAGKHTNNDTSPKGDSTVEPIINPRGKSDSPRALIVDPNGPIDENLLQTKNGSPVLLKGFTVKNVAGEGFLKSLNMGEVEELILGIYASHGAEFESSSAQAWANKQPWYRRMPGLDIHKAERLFTKVDKTNVELLIKRWNDIQVEDGHAPLPVEESPLAGRGDSSETEGDSQPEAARGNLNPDDIATWNASRVRYEINTIYARYGVVFPKKEIQAYFESKDWYKPVPGLTFEQAEQKFSEQDRNVILTLAARRSAFESGNPSAASFPQSTPLSQDLINTWDSDRIRNEINRIYARYGVDFTNAELRKWSETLPDYKRVERRTFADAEALFSDTDRNNIKLLATRRSQIKNGN